MAYAAFKSVEPLLAEGAEPNPDDWAKALDAALRAAEGAGWQLVPKEATGLMAAWGVREFCGPERYARDHEYCDATFTERAREAYRAMLAAAPKAGGGSDEVDEPV